MKYCYMLLLAFYVGTLSAQIDSIHFNKISEFEYSGADAAYSSLFDRNNQPYIYTTSMQLGLVVFDISNINNPMPIDTLPTSMFGGSHVTNLHQDGNYLYLSLGSFQGTTQKAGLAILDISNPANINITDLWDSTAYSQGAAIVKTQGQYAYLGAMEDGIIVLNIANKQDIQFVSHYQPDLTWPGVTNYDPNARGMDIRNDTLFLAFDAGGLRLIDISDKNNLNQITQYINTALTAIANPAYNNIRVVGSYAYIPVDFCGLDVVDISNPNNLHSVAWYNPWNCNGGSWFGSPGHSNELILTNNDSLLFMSGGDTEAIVFDLSNPAQPKRLGAYEFVGDSAVSWGLDAYNGRLVLSMIDNSAVLPIFQPFQPYYSDYGGIQILDWQAVVTNLKQIEKHSTIRVFPNPSQHQLNIQLDQIPTSDWIDVYSTDGCLVHQFYCRKNTTQQIDISSLPQGMYWLQLQTNEGILHQRFIKL